eukprot:1391526-Amorphochlora_amoeboformis.AAC.1
MLTANLTLRTFKPAASTIQSLDKLQNITRSRLCKVTDIFPRNSNGAELHLASSKVKTAGRHHIVFTPKQRPKPQTESQTLFTEHLSLEGSTARAVDQLGKTPGTRVREKSKEEAEKVGESLSDDIFDKMTREEHQGEVSVFESV